MAQRAAAPSSPPASRALPALRQGRAVPAGLVLRETCDRCGLDYAFADSGDGPAVFAIFILGFLVLGGALLAEFKLQPAGVGARRAVGHHHAAAGVLPAARAQGDADCAAVQAQGRGGPLRLGLRRSHMLAGSKVPAWSGRRRSRLPALAVLVGLGSWQLERKAVEGGADRQDSRARQGGAGAARRGAARWREGGDVEYLHVAERPLPPRRGALSLRAAPSRASACTSTRRWRSAGRQRAGQPRLRARRTQGGGDAAGRADARAPSASRAWCAGRPGPAGSRRRASPRATSSIGRTPRP